MAACEEALAASSARTEGSCEKAVSGCNTTCSSKRSFVMRIPSAAKATLPWPWLLSFHAQLCCMLTAPDSRTNTAGNALPSIASNSHVCAAQTAQPSCVLPVAIEQPLVCAELLGLALPAPAPSATTASPSTPGCGCTKGK